MALARPAVALPSGVLDNPESLGALLRHPECSALVIGVVELPQHKRPTACRLGSTVANMSVHGVSGAGSSDSLFLGPFDALPETVGREKEAIKR